MVDGIKAAGGSAATAVTRAAPVGNVAPAATPTPTPSAADTAQLAALARSMSAAAPVDADRVQRIKTAIANGTFPILPATIADQMLSFRYEWMSNDPQAKGGAA